MDPELYIRETISNIEIKKIRSLSQKKYRQEYGLFVVEGEKMLREVVSSGFIIDSIYRKEEIGEKSMSRISMLSSPSPVLAVVKIPDNDELQIKSSLSGLSLALDSINDPGNMGTIMRIADWFGIKTIYSSPGSVDIYNPKVVQASMGAIFRVKTIYTDLRELTLRYKEAGKCVYGAFLDGEIIYETKLSADGLIIIGNESEGISDDLAKLIDRKIFIPPYPAEAINSESLNAAVATAIICSEFRRREV